MKQRRKVQRSIPRQMTCDLFRDSARCSVCSGDIFNTSSSPSGWIGQLLTKRWPRRVSAARSACIIVRRAFWKWLAFAAGRAALSFGLFWIWLQDNLLHVICFSSLSHVFLHHGGRYTEIFYPTVPCSDKMWTFATPKQVRTGDSLKKHIFGVRGR